MTIGTRVRITNPNHGYLGMTGDIIAKRGRTIEVQVSYKDHIVVLTKDDVEVVG